MTTTTDLDPRIADWLAAAPEAPTTLAARIASSTAAVRQPGLGWRGRLDGRTNGRARLLVATVTFGVVVILVGVLIRGWIPDPHRVVAPPPSTSPGPTADHSAPPTGTPAPSPSAAETRPTGTPTPTDLPTEHPYVFDAASLTETFHSDLYGYTIRHPADWYVIVGEEAWVPDGPLTFAKVADVIWLGPQRLSIKAAGIPDGVTRSVFLASLSTHGVIGPDGTGYCKFGGTMMPPPTDISWRSEPALGHDAVYRGYCGYAELVVFVGRTAYVVSMFTERVQEAERRRFDLLVSTMTFDRPAPPSPSRSPAPPTDRSGATRPFHSELYGYSIRFPSDWFVDAGKQAWHPGDSWARLAVADTGRLGSQRSWIVAGLLTNGTTPADLLAILPAHDEYSVEEHGDAHCRFSGIEMPGSGSMEMPGPVSIDWRPESTLGHLGYYRGYCGYAEMVIFVDKMAYVVTLWTGRIPEGDRRPLDDLLSTLTFDG